MKRFKRKGSHWVGWFYEEVTIAVLPPGDELRTKQWATLFQGSRVPVRACEPAPTILPDGRFELCYFVDIKEAGQGLLEHLFAHNEQFGGAFKEALRECIVRGVYPIIAERVVTVRARRGLWFKE